MINVLTVNEMKFLVYFLAATEQPGDYPIVRKKFYNLWCVGVIRLGLFKKNAGIFDCIDCRGGIALTKMYSECPVHPNY